jgi:hypothetical protein
MWRLTSLSTLAFTLLARASLACAEGIARGEAPPAAAAVRVQQRYSRSCAQPARDA